MVGTIIFYFVVLLLLYYMCMISYDIYKQKNIDAENKDNEEEIDISGEANTFAVTHISRKTSQSLSTNLTSEEINKETNDEDIEPEVTENELKVTEDNFNVLLSTLGMIPNEVRFAEGNPTNIRQPIMTGFMSPDELVNIVHEKSKEGNSDMGDIIAECQNAA